VIGWIIGGRLTSRAPPGFSSVPGLPPPRPYPLDPTIELTVQSAQTQRGRFAAFRGELSGDIDERYLTSTRAPLDEAAELQRFEEEKLRLEAERLK
jgi:hypothetical protein